MLKMWTLSCLPQIVNIYKIVFQDQLTDFFHFFDKVYNLLQQDSIFYYFEFAPNQSQTHSQP